MDNPALDLYNRGDIAERAMSSTIDWPNLTFLAHAQGESFQNFSVVTLIAHYQMRAHEEAMEQVKFNGDEDAWTKDLHQRAVEIIESGKLQVQEMVQVDDNYNVLVVLDDFQVSDTSMDRALKMLENSDIPGTTFFGNRITYTAEQVASHTEFFYNQQEI